MGYLKKFSLGSKEVNFPIFLPDATKGAVKGLDGRDLKEAGVEGVVVNSFHLTSEPGTTVVKSLGKLKRFMNWDGWVVSDSGGFQLLSLVYENKSYGSVNDDGIRFSRDSKGRRKRHNFTPEKSIQVQFNLGADIMICLDDCPPISAGLDENQLSVRRTIEWAKRCKDEFLKQLEDRKETAHNRPLLFAVIQGGNYEDLREKCAKELMKIGFDGFCFGGWPLDKEKNLNRKILLFTATLMPDGLPKFALGVGNPQALIDCVKMGYNIFDCVLPTRDARHHRLYVFSKDPRQIAFNDEVTNITEFIYIKDEKYARDPRPISDYCDCYTCRNYSRAYLRHLFEIEDPQALRLSSIHNLRVYTKLTEVLREDVL